MTKVNFLAILASNMGEAFEKLQNKLKKYPTLSVVRDRTGELRVWEDLSGAEERSTSIFLSREHPDQAYPDVTLAVTTLPKDSQKRNSAQLEYTHFRIRPEADNSSEVLASKPIAQTDAETLIRNARVGAKMFNYYLETSWDERKVVPNNRIYDYMGGGDLYADLAAAGIQAKSEVGEGLRAAGLTNAFSDPEPHEFATYMRTVLTMPVREFKVE